MWIDMCLHLCKYQYVLASYLLLLFCAGVAHFLNLPFRTSQSAAKATMNTGRCLAMHPKQSYNYKPLDAQNALNVPGVEKS